MPMTQERMNQIAFLYVKRKIARDGIHIGQNFKEKLSAEAKEIGIEKEEAMEFMEIIMREEFEKIFAKA